jgi:hypothetical protein
MVAAIAADSTGNTIATLLGGLVMVSIGAVFVTDYKRIVSRLTVDAVDRAVRIRSFLHLRDETSFKEKWTHRQIIFARIWGALLLCLGIIFILLTAFIRE